MYRDMQVATWYREFRKEKPGNVAKRLPDCLDIAVAQEGTC